MKVSNCRVDIKKTKKKEPLILSFRLQSFCPTDVPSHSSAVTNPLCMLSGGKFHRPWQRVRIEDDLLKKVCLVSESTRSEDLGFRVHIGFL